MNIAKTRKFLLSSSLSVFLVGCGGAPNYSQSEMHVTVEEVDSQKQIKPKKIPSLVKASPTAPGFSNASSGEDTFDVTVVAAPVRDLLFVLARDSGINMDIDDTVSGVVSINALDQTLDAILARIAEQVAIRVEYVGDAIIIKTDSPYYKQYQIDYLSLARNYSSSVGSGGLVEGSSSGIGNSSSIDFWESLDSVISKMVEGGFEVSDETGALATGDEALKEVTKSEQIVGQQGNYYDINQSLGVLVVYAPDKIQKKVAEYLASMSLIASRQVLLEATVVEVVLNNQYAQGIDWSLFNSLAQEGIALYQGANVGGAAAAIQFITKSLDRELTGRSATREAAEALIFGQIAAYDDDPFTTITEQEFSIEPVEDDDGNITGYDYELSLSLEELSKEVTDRLSGGLVPNSLAENNYFTAAYRAGDLSAAVQLLDEFGDSKVLSSPRISAVNNQPALLKVVDQEVYFDVTIENEINENTGQITGSTFEVEENVVDVGFVLAVLPNISADGEILLNLRPSVTRIIGYKPVPSFSGVDAGSNVVPITRVRELESIISLRDGEVAVMGGLLEDRTTETNTGVPGLSDLPSIGSFFQKKTETTSKTEFVVFLRATIINNPSINGDYSSYRRLLPNSDFIIRDTEDSLLAPGMQKTR